MFTTLRCDANARLQVDSEQSATLLSRRRACKNCHSKKLRCTRERNGCRRCVSSKVSCEYESSRLKNGRTKPLRNRTGTRNITPEASFDDYNTERCDIQFHTNLTSDTDNLTLDGLASDPAVYNPRFEISNDLFDFLDGNFEDPTGGSTVPPSRPENVESSQSDTAIEGPAYLTEPNGVMVRKPCHCLVSAVSLLESISIQYIQANLKSVPQIIHHNKSALLQCRALYTCNVCSKKSEFVMLLIFLCQKIISSYKRTIEFLIEQFNRLYCPNEDNIIQLSVPSREAAMAAAREVELREYQVDVEEEPCVFAGIVQMQIKKMMSFLGMLKVMASADKWTSHIAMADLVGFDINELLRLCRCQKDS